MRIAHCGQAHSPKLAQGAHHVKHHARLARLTEVQIVPHHDIEKIVRRQGAIVRRLDVVTGDKKLLAPIRRCKDRGVRVVGPVGKKLQS